MTPDVPGPYAAFLLAVAAYRIWRLLAEDDILDRPRRYLLGLGDWQEPDPAPDTYRTKWAELLTCPWCLGFWIALTFWVAWQLEPAWTLWFAVPWVLSAGVALANAIIGALTE